jgi:hypothetical protein
MAAQKGHRPALPAPSLEELLSIKPDRHRYFLEGHRAALFDELNAALQAAYRANRRRPADMSVLPDGGRDARIQPDDPVTVPYWAFKAVYKLALENVVSGPRGKGPHARWRKQCEADQIHWHRYALVKKALMEKRAKYPPGKPDVYQVVSNELTGTAFAAKASGIRKSAMKVVAPALKRGHHARFYRSTSDRLYDFLLNTLGPTTIVVGS